MTRLQRATVARLVERYVAAGRAHAMKSILHASRPEVVSQSDLEAARHDFDTAKRAFELFVACEE